MAYFIKSFTNTYNQYKYHYLDHIAASIDMRDNYWSFDIDLFSINDFSLPNNSLCADLQLPYQLVQNIAFNLKSDQTGATANVTHNKSYAKLFNSHFDVDISENAYLKQDLSKVELLMELNLYIDPEQAKGAGDAIKQEELDALINNTNEQRWSFDMYYANTYLIEHSANIENIVGYNLTTGHTCSRYENEIEVRCNSLSQLKHSFNELVSISSLYSFQILFAKVKFYYWVDYEGEYKTLEKTLNVSSSSVKSITISLDDYTIFDFDKQEVKFDPLGVLGFNIPRLGQGYYEVELKILQDYNISKLVVKNDFTFNQDEVKPYMTITNKVIESIEGFKEVKFND